MAMIFSFKKEADKQEKNLLKLWDHFLDFFITYTRTKNPNV